MLRRISVVALLLALVGCGEEGREIKNDDSCASGERWVGGDEESPYMNPGQACIACHDSDREAPSLAVAGTVYGVAREADNCLGADGYTVKVTGADGTVRTMSSNRAGNFYIERGSVATPYTATVTTPDGVVRQMVTPQVDTDCNACHTVNGANLAPGRL